MKKYIFMVLLLAISGGVFYFWKTKKTSQGSQKEDSPWILVKAEKGNIRLVVDTTGRIIPNLEVEIKCKASGQIEKLPYDVSDFVPEDKLIIELDPIDEKRRVLQAQAALSASQAKLAQAKKNLEISEKRLETDKKRAESALRSAEAKELDARTKANTLKSLLAQKLAPQEDYDTAKATAIQAASDLENAKIRKEELDVDFLSLELKRQDVTLAESQVKSDEVELDLAKQREKDTKVFSPISGVVSSRLVQKGQIISSGINSVSGGTTMLMIADLSRIFVLASVDESDIGKIEVDQPAIITADAHPGISFYGQVVRIAAKGVNASNVVTFEVKIEVLSPQKKLLKPEMTANVKVIAAQKNKVILVPSEAVFRKTIRPEKKENPDEKGAEKNKTPSTPEKGKNPPEKGKNPPEKTPSEKGKEKDVESPFSSPSNGKDSETKDPSKSGNGKNSATKDPSKSGKRSGFKKFSMDPPIIKYFVMVGLEGKEPEEREVEIGINDGLKTEIIQGLKEGEMVAIRKGEEQSQWRKNNMTNNPRRMMMMGGSMKR